jgi:hypothetical protein
MSKVLDVFFHVSSSFYLCLWNKFNAILSVSYFTDSSVCTVYFCTHILFLLEILDYGHLLLLNKFDIHNFPSRVKTSKPPFFLVMTDDNYSTNKAHLLIFRELLFFYLLNVFHGDDEYLFIFRPWILRAVTRWLNISVCLGIELFSSSVLVLGEGRGHLVFWHQTKVLNVDTTEFPLFLFYRDAVEDGYVDHCRVLSFLICSS